MTTAKRPYINKEFNQFVDDDCLRYRSIPMAVVDTMLKQKRIENDFTGIKRVFNNIPARPININALATTIARMNGLPYSSVEDIAMKIIAEEVLAVKEFVRKNKDPFTEVVAFSPQVYTAEQATISSGVPLRPQTIKERTIDQLANTRAKQIMDRSIGERSEIKGQSKSFIDQLANKRANQVMNRSIGEKREIELLLGDESQTYNTPGFNLQPSMSSTVRERLRRGDDPRLAEFNRNPQFIDPATGINRFVNQDLDRSLYIVEPLRVQGTEPRPQIRHQNRDAVFGESYSKN